MSQRIPIDMIIRLSPKWFNKDNIRFFKSRWNNYAYKLGEYAYFISSEKHVNYFVGVNDPRKYTIRKFNMNTGDFSTDNKDIFNFQRYSTKKQAEKELRIYLAAEPIRADKVAYLESEIKHKEHEIEREKREIDRLVKELRDIWEAPKMLITCLQCGEIYYSYSDFEESHKNILKDTDKYKLSWVCVEAS